MNRIIFSGAFASGGLAALWVAYGFLGANPLALLMTMLVIAVYLIGAQELRRHQQETSNLTSSLVELQQPPTTLEQWVDGLPPGLQASIRLRIEGARVAMPGPALTPYLVGLLVMLGMLGTFMGMVVTLNGAAFTLEGTADLQAIRSAFAVPIKGLGLSFGTSVAGVATSAMLGLMSTIARRERMGAASMLDAKIAGPLRRFTPTYQREQSLFAMQEQAKAFPLIAENMQAAMSRMEAWSRDLNGSLLMNQDRFHNETKAVYTALAQSVDQTLRASVAQSASLAAESIKPVVIAAMAALSEESALQHSRQVDTLQNQLDALAARLSAAAGNVTDAWTQAVTNQDRVGLALSDKLGQTLDEFSRGFEARSMALVQDVQASHASAQAAQASNDSVRLAAWLQSLDQLASSIKLDRAQAAADTLTQQQQLTSTWTQAAMQVASEAKHSATQTMSEIALMGHAVQDLARTRLAAEATWGAEHREQTQKMVTMLRAELALLREEESQRGRAAVDRLAELQADVGDHLAKLGAALEEPISKLIATASEAPRAAAEVIGKLRQEVSSSVARDNELLGERTRILDTLNGLLEGINQASQAQRAGVETLVASSASALDATSQQFAERIELETAKLAAISAHVTSSAVDVSALGDTLGFAMRTFNDANEKLITNLQRIEGALAKSMSRSDDQLAYYVAQAREIIDLSVTSQKDMVVVMQQLSGHPATATEEVAG